MAIVESAFVERDGERGEVRSLTPKLSQPGSNLEASGGRKRLDCLEKAVTTSPRRIIGRMCWKYLST